MSASSPSIPQHNEWPPFPGHDGAWPSIPESALNENERMPIFAIPSPTAPALPGAGLDARQASSRTAPSAAAEQSHLTTAQRETSSENCRENGQETKNSPQPERELWTLAEVAERLRISFMTFWRRAKTNPIYRPLRNARRMHREHVAWLVAVETGLAAPEVALAQWRLGRTWEEWRQARTQAQAFVRRQGEEGVRRRRPKGTSGEGRVAGGE